MAVIWRKNMSVGNDLIDHDHHFMINFVNTIELVLQTPREKDMLLAVFEQLHDYALAHFRREESIQRKIEYPNSLNHRVLHAELAKQLNELIHEITNSNDPLELEQKAPDIVAFLKHWLMDHVLKEDLLLKPFLEKHPRGFF